MQIWEESEKKEREIYILTILNFNYFELSMRINDITIWCMIKSRDDKKNVIQMIDFFGSNFFFFLLIELDGI